MARPRSREERREVRELAARLAAAGDSSGSFPLDSIYQNVLSLAREVLEQERAISRAIEFLASGCQTTVKDPIVLKRYLHNAWCVLGGKDVDDDIGDEIKLLELARRVGDIWRTQEGINGQLLDELAEATKQCPR